MKFKKNNKKIVVMLGASALALGTVGFASWIINEQVQIDKQNVNVAFGDVQDTSCVATLDSNNSNFELSFDAKQDNDGKITSPENKEDLEFHFKFSFKVGSSKTLSGVKFTMDSDPFSTLVTNKFITAAYATEQTVTLVEDSPAGTYVTDNFTSYTKGEAAGKPQSHVVTYEEGTRTYTFVSTFNFNWGEKFNGKNPSIADNEGQGGSLTPDNIINNLNDFKTAYGTTTGQKVGVTITPVLN